MPEREVVITYRGNRYPAYTGRKFRLVLDVPEGYQLQPADVAPLVEQQLERLRTEERKRATALASQLNYPSLGELVAESLRTPITPAAVPRGGVDVFAGLRDKVQAQPTFQAPVVARSLPTSVKQVAERAHLEAQMPKATPQQLKKISQYFSPIANWLGFYPTTPQLYLDAAKSAVREGIDLYYINKWMEGQGLSAATRAYILKQVSPIVDLETSGDLATKIYREGSFFLWRLSQFVGGIPRFLGQIIHDVAVVNSEYSGPNTWLREAIENTTGVRGVKPTEGEVKQAEKRLKDVAKGLYQDIRRLLPHKGWTKDMEDWYRRDSIVGPAVTLAILLDGMSLALRGTGQAVGAASERTFRQAIKHLREQPVKVGTPEEVQAELVARAIVNVIRERLSQIEKRNVSAAEVLERIRGKSESEVARMLHPTAKTVAEGLEKAGYSVGLLTRFVNPLEWLRMTEEQFVSVMEKSFGISRDVWERYWQEASAARQRAQWAQEMKAKATGGTPPPTEQPPSGRTWAMEPPKPLPAPERPSTAETGGERPKPVAPEPQPQTPEAQPAETLPLEESPKSGAEPKPTEKVPPATEQPIPAEEYIPKRIDLRPEQLGTENLSYTAKHTAVRTQWAVVELDDLKVSHNPLTWHENPDYPQVLQPRDRSAAAMQQQVKEIAQNLVPEKLGDSPSTSGGAPIVGEDGIVESGNGRTLALLLAYQYNPSAAEKYRRWLLENADRFGINPLVVQQLRRPVLVRIRPVEGDLRERASLVLEMGLSDVAQFSPVDRAMADARIIERHINLFKPDFDLDAKENKRFVDAVLKDMPTSEVSQLLLPGGQLSLTGISRLYAALLAYGYGSPALLEKLESPDLEVQRLAKGVAAGAPEIAALRSGLSIIRRHNREVADAYDIGNDIAQAVLLMEQLRKGGRNVRDFIEQGELFGGDYAIPRIVKLLLLAFDRLRSVKALRLFLKTYADLAGRAATLAAAPDESLTKQLLEQKKQLPDKEKLLLIALRQAEGGGTAGLFDDEEVLPDLPTAEELLSGIQQGEKKKEAEPKPTAKAEKQQAEAKPTAEAEPKRPEAQPAGEVAPSDAGDIPLDAQRRQIVDAVFAQVDEVLREGLTPAEVHSRLWELFAEHWRDNASVTAWAAKRIGGGEYPQWMSEGDYLDVLYDSLEGVLNVFPPSEYVDVYGGFSVAERLEGLLPRRKRTLHVGELQQFSTPFPIAYLMALASGYELKDVVYEPSAGTGNLVGQILNKAVDREANPIIVNDLSPRRLYILKRVIETRRKALGTAEDPPVIMLNQDALQLTDKAFDPKPSLIIMNPPWGAYSTGKYGVSAFPDEVDVAERHFWRAFEHNLADGGRLVALMPTTVLRETSKFIERLHERAAVRLLLKLPGQLYERRGTSVESLLVVVDKVPPTEVSRRVSVEEVSNIQSGRKEVIDLARRVGRWRTKDVKPVYEEGVSVDVRVPSVSRFGSAATAGLAGGESGAEPEEGTGVIAGEASVVSAPAGGVAGTVQLGGSGVGEAESAGRQVVGTGEPSAMGPSGARAVGGGEETPSTGGGQIPAEHEQITGQVDEGTGRHAGGLSQAGTAGGEGEATGRHGHGSGGFAPSEPGAVRVIAGDLDELRRREILEQDIASLGYDPRLYTAYSPRATSPVVPHPRQVLLPASLAGIEPDPITVEVPDILRRMHSDGVISDAQFDAVMLMLNAFENNHGFVLADDVGLGKTREIGAYLYSLFWQGKINRALVTTFSGTNVAEMIAVLEQTFSKYVPGVSIFNLRDLQGETGGGLKDFPIADRAIYVVDAAGKFKDAVWSITGMSRAREKVPIDVWVADEAHTTRGGEDSEKNRAWRAMHAHMFLNDSYRIVYSTATPAQSPTELREFYALRLWTLDINSWHSFIGMLQADLTSTTTWEELQEKAHSAASQTWFNIDRERGRKVKPDRRRDAPTVQRRVLQYDQMEQLMRELYASNRYTSRDLARGGVTFEVRELPLTPEEEELLDKLAETIRRALYWYQIGRRIDRRPHPGFPWSHAQFLMKRVHQGLRLRKILPEIRRLLSEGKQVVLYVESVTETSGESGSVDTILKSISTEQWLRGDAGSYTFQGEHADLVIAKQELHEQFSQLLDIPAPIDLLEKEFGRERVANITGESSPSRRKLLIDEFQRGKRRIVLLSSAGQAGISLHHDSPSTGQRVLFFLDMPWRSDSFRQILGRVDRTGQLTSPHVVLVRSGAAGENKIIATVAGRLASLGALSKAESQAVAGAESLEEYDVDPAIGAMAVRKLWRELDPAEKAFYVRDEFAKQVNRNGTALPLDDLNNPDYKAWSLTLMTCLPAKLQARHYDRFTEIYEDLAGVERARASRHRGTIEDETELTPSVRLYTVRTEQNLRYGILSGRLLLPVRGTAPLIHLVSEVVESGADTGFVTFRDVRSGKVVSGLRIGMTALGRLMALLSTEGEFDLDKAWTFLQVGRVVLTQSPDPEKPYVLRRTRTREGLERIRIDNASVSQRDVLLAAGARFDARLGYWYLNWNVFDLEQFVKQFPLKPYSEVKKWEEEQSARRGGKGGGTPSSGAGKGVFYREELPPIPNIGEGVAGRGEHPQGIILRLGRWIRVGRTPKRAAGYYDPRTADVVIRRWGDIPTAVHEVAHAIDDEFGILAEWAEPRKHSPFDEELFAFLPEHLRKRGSLRDRRAEAFAYWFESYVLNPEVAAGSAPQFYAHLQMMLPGDMWDAIQAWAEEIRNWVYTPAGEKVRAQFTFDKPKPEDIPDTFRVHWVDQLVRIFIDDRWPAIKAWREAKRRRGLHPLPSEDFELLVTLWAGRYGKFVEMLHHGVPADQQGQRRSIPFIEMLRELDTSSRQAFIQDAFDLFAFMGAERAIELMERKEAQAYNKFRKTIGLPEKEEDAHDPSDIEKRLSQMGGDEAERLRSAWVRVQQSLEEQAKRITGWGGGILRDDDIAREHLETLRREEPDRYERLRRIAGMYRDIADHVLQYAVSSGRITKEQYDAIKASNRYYVDFHRVFGWESPRAEVSRSGKVSRVSAITWEIQGSSRRIHNPLVSLMESIARAIAECDRNYALAQFVNALELEREIYEGEPTLMADIGRRVNGPTKNAILVFRKGKGEWWEFHPEVVRAFNAWQDAYASDGWNIFAKVWGAVARLAYEGITKHPRFLLGNVVRDTLERLVRSPFKPVRARGWQRHWWQFFGGSHAGFLHLQRDDYYAELEKLMDELVRDRRFWVLPVRVLKRLWHWYLRMAEASEEFGRLNEFASAQRYAEEVLGYGNWDAMLFAAFASRRYMDFRVAGSLVRVLNRLVPFTSASVRALSMGVEALIGTAGGGGGKRGNGGDVGAGGDMPWHYRRWGVEGMVTDSHRAWSAWLRLLLFVAIPSILVYLWNNRDEDTGREYREFPPYLRYMFWLVHTPFGWVSIWKPYEFGVLGSIFEAAIEGDMEDWAKALSRVALPLDEGDLALGFAGIVGAVANYDFFRGRWIVPPIEERRALKDSRGRWARDVYAASPLAQALGRELNVDPRKVDYLLRTQFGHAGAMLGEASRMAGGERTLWDFILWQFGTKRELTPYMAESVQETLDKAAQTGRDSKVRGLRELIERWYRQRARGASPEELRPLLHRIIGMAGRQERRVSRPFRSKVRPPK